MGVVASRARASGWETDERNDEAIDGEIFFRIILAHILLFSLTRNRRTQAETENQTKVQNVAVGDRFLLVGWLFGNKWWLVVGWWHTGETEPKNKERKEEGKDEIQTNPLIRWWGNWIDIYYRFDNNTKWHQSSVDSGQKNIHSAADRSTLTFDPDRLAEYRGIGLTFVTASRTLNHWPVK